MDRATELLTDIRFLLARAGGDSPPSTEEIAVVRNRLSSMRAHPSCSPARAEKLSSALLVLDVLALASAETVGALAV
jgi:hypothetical protein